MLYAEFLNVDMLKEKLSPGIKSTVKYIVSFTSVNEKARQHLRILLAGWLVVVQIKHHNGVACQMGD